MEVDKQETTEVKQEEVKAEEVKTEEPATENGEKKENGTAKKDDDEGGELIMAKAFVWNLPPKTTVEELSKLFEPYGPITKCDVVKRWGFVHLTEQSELERAIKELDQTEFKEFTISVKQSRAKDPNKKPKEGDKKKPKRAGDGKPGQGGKGGNRDGYRRNNDGARRNSDGSFVRDKARRFARIVNYELQKMQSNYGGGFDGPSFGNGYGNNWGSSSFGGRSGPWANGNNGPSPLMNRGFDNGPWANSGGMGGNFGGNYNSGSGFGCGDFGRRNGGFMDDYRGGSMNRGSGMMDRFSGNGGGWSRRK